MPHVFSLSHVRPRQVDDDPFASMVLVGLCSQAQKSFTAEGSTVDSVDSMEACMQKLGSAPYDLVAAALRPRLPPPAMMRRPG